MLILSIEPTGARQRRQPRENSQVGGPMKRLILVAALSAPLASPIAAQTTPDVIPRDVVLAILRNNPMQGMQGGGDPVIFVDDHLPPNLMNKVSLPPGAHIVATLESWSSTDVIGTAPAAPDSVRAWFADEFIRRKYEAQDSPGYRQPFRPATGSVNGGFCGAGTYFSISAQARQGGRTEFVIHARQGPTCDQRVVFSPNVYGGGSTSGNNAPTLPMLVNPKTAEVSPQRCDSRYGQISFSSTQAALSTTASPEQLLTHYGKQLDSAGWKRETTSTGAVGTWTRRDSTGRDVRVQLTALPGPAAADCRMLTMTSTGVRP
jgi:hypothetical protein